MLAVLTLPLMLAACATGTTGTTMPALRAARTGTPAARTGTAAHASTAPTTSAPSASTGAPSHRQRAEQDVAAIFASFAPPPGARRLTAEPAAAKQALSGFAPASAATTPDQVTKAGWWQVAGAPRQVLAWVGTHLPSRFTKDSSGTSGSVGKTVQWSEGFGLPDVPGVLTGRGLGVSVVSAGSGQTGILVQAQVTWLPTRTASEMIPAGARAVTFTLHHALGVRTTKPAPVTVTAPAAVGALVSLVNDLPLFPPGEYSCPADVGGGLVLTFRAAASAGTPAASGRVIATATVRLSGCEGVELAIGTRQVGLGPVGGGTKTAARALRLAGVHWSLPN